MFDTKSTFDYLTHLPHKAGHYYELLRLTRVVTVCFSRLCSSGPHCTSRWYSAARPLHPMPPEIYTWTSWTPRRPSEAKQRHLSPKRSNRHSATRESPIPPRAALENRLEQSGEKNPGWKHSSRLCAAAGSPFTSFAWTVCCLCKYMHNTGAFTFSQVLFLTPSVFIVVHISI